MKKDTIVYADFSKLDIRVGEVINATYVEKSDKLIELTVDLGVDYGTVTILTAMAKHATVEDFAHKKFYFLANLEPRKMMGKFSQGMVLIPEDDEKPMLVNVPETIPNGTTLH